MFSSLPGIVSRARIMHRFLSRSDESDDLTRRATEAPANVLYGTLRRPTECNAVRADDFVAAVENLCIMRAWDSLSSIRSRLRMGRDGPEKRCRIDERECYGADESKICRNPAKNCPKPPENGDLSLLLSLQFNDNKEDRFREICVQEGGCHLMMASPDYA